MKRRKSPRRKRTKGWNLHRRRRMYADDRELLAYEDSIIVPLVHERGFASVADWTMQDPGRWHERNLKRALERLVKAGVLHRDGWSGPWNPRHMRGYRTTYKLESTREESKAA